MIVDLIHKEFKQTFDKDSSKMRFALKILGSIIGIGIFVALESFIFLALDKKINEFSKGEGTYYFLVLFLSILLILTIIVSLNSARKVLYQRNDSEILLRLPVIKEEVIISKFVFIYLNNVLTNFIVSFPLLCCFCATRGLKPPFYVMSALYPLFIGIFTCGITLIFVSFYNYIYKFIKNKPWLQITLGSILVIALCFGYQYILQLFINLINNAQFDAMFSKKFLDSLSKFSRYFIPVINLTGIIANPAFNLFQNILIFTGSTLLVIVLGFTISSISYSKFLKKEFSEDKSTTSKNIKKKACICSINKALIKKEFILLFRNSNYIFSYTSLLIMQPFLAFVVISTMNSLLYENMKMFLAYFPEMINGLNLLLILLFSSVIVTSGMDAFSRENKSLVVSKYIPVSPTKQALIKLIVPITLSLFSLFVTTTLLISFSKISLLVYFVSLLMGIILITSLAIASIFIDLKKLNSKNSGNIQYLSAILSIFVPIFLFILHILMMYFKFSAAIIYSILILTMLCILLPLVLTFRKTINKNFKDMRFN